MDCDELIATPQEMNNTSISDFCMMVSMACRPENMSIPICPSHFINRPRASEWRAKPFRCTVSRSGAKKTSKNRSYEVYPTYDVNPCAPVFKTCSWRREGIEPTVLSGLRIKSN
jgi:hypothetical protein